MSLQKNTQNMHLYEKKISKLVLLKHKTHLF
jgi:hypothetical protein